MSRYESDTAANELFADNSANERSQAENAIRIYLEVVKRIYDHVALHDKETLTELRRRARLRKDREKSA